MQGGLRLCLSFVERTNGVVFITQLRLNDVLCKERSLGHISFVPIAESSLTHALRFSALRELTGSLFLVEGLLAGCLDRVT